MKPLFPSPVAEWHNETYAAIDPKRPELSMAGKTVVITGGGTGIGRETVRAFALAGATSIHILGRTQATLAETKKIVKSDVPGVNIVLHTADVTDQKTVQKVAQEVGKWDVLILNAGYLAKRSPIKDLDVDEWWLGFEINIKGGVIVAKAFLPNRNQNASLVAVSSAGITFPVKTVEGSSSYVTSKLATIKLFEFVAAEYPDVQVVTVHPGVVDTALNSKSEFKGLPMDDVKLSAHFMLWAASPEAAFAAGRFIWCNWDVSQLKTIEKKFQEDELFLTTGMLGWPFP